MGRPLRADGQRTRQLILDAALKLFAERGYFGTSLRDIAAAVGVRESALYNYFPGKEALFNAIIDSVREQRDERVAEVLARSNELARSLLQRLTLFLLDEFCAPQAQQLFRVLMSDGQRLAREGRINLLDRMTSGATPLHKLFRALVASGDLRPQHPRVLVLEFMGPLLMWRHGHALNPRAAMVVRRTVFAREHVDHFLRGAGATESRHPAPRQGVGGARSRARVSSTRTSFNDLHS